MGILALVFSLALRANRAKGLERLERPVERGTRPNGGPCEKVRLTTGHC